MGPRDIFDEVGQSETCATCQRPFDPDDSTARHFATYCSRACETAEDGPDDDPDAWAGGFAENH